jgi:hypothetical protein
MSADEQKIADKINELYEIDEVIEGALLKYFYVNSHNTTWWTPTYEILSTLEDPTRGALRGATTYNARTLAGVLTKMGCTVERRDNVRRQRVRGWVGVTQI